MNARWLTLAVAGMLAVAVVSPVTAEESANAVVVEVLGKSSITASVAYERHLGGRLSVGTGFGINNISRVDFVYGDETIRATDVSMPVSLYAVVSPIGTRHRLIVPFGVVAFTEFSLHPYRRYITANFVPFVGMGYELHGERWSFRAPVYLAWLGEPSEMLPAIMPWAGFSLGRSF